MTNGELDRLEALAQSVIDDTDASKWWTVSSLAPLLTAEAKASTAEIDAAFVAAASPDVVLRLVAELREARDALDDALDHATALDQTNERILVPIWEPRDEDMARLLVEDPTIVRGPYGATARCVGDEAERAERKRDSLIAERAPYLLRRVLKWIDRARAQIITELPKFRDVKSDRDRLAAELSAARAEGERLRAMVPSEEVVLRIRTSVEYDCEDHGCDISEDFWRPVGEWLARIESAKETGR